MRFAICPLDWPNSGRPSSVERMMRIDRKAVFVAVVRVAALLDQPLPPQCGSLLLGGHLRVALGAKAFAIVDIPKKGFVALMRNLVVDFQRRLDPLAPLARVQIALKHLRSKPSLRMPPASAVV
jgi:hypothetical protein